MDKTVIPPFSLSFLFFGSMASETVNRIDYAVMHPSSSRDVGHDMVSFFFSYFFFLFFSFLFGEGWTA